MESPKRPSQRYLGDGVYVELNGDMLLLTTTDGYKITNTIYLEPRVFDHLLDYTYEVGWREGNSSVEE